MQKGLYELIDDLKAIWSDKYERLSKELDLAMGRGATYGEISGNLDGFFRRIKK